MQIELNPWLVPDIVIGKIPPAFRQAGFHPEAVPKWKLSEVDAKDLAKQCDKFRAEVFCKAGKADPVNDPVSYECAVCGCNVQVKRGNK